MQLTGSKKKNPFSSAWNICQTRSKRSVRSLQSSVERLLTKRNGSKSSTKYSGSFFKNVMSTWLNWTVRYALNLLNLLSIIVNNVFFLAFDPTQSLSTRAFENQDSWFWYRFYLTTNFLFFREENHCKAAFLNALKRGNRRRFKQAELIEKGYL